MLRNHRQVGGMVPIVLAAAAILVLATMGWSNAAGSDRRSSDLFWSLAWIDGVQAEGYTSPADIYGNTDAVVVGHLKSIEPGRVIGDTANDNAAHYVTVTLEIERTLRARPGALPTDGPLKLELVSFQQEVVDKMIDAFRPERGLYFLTSKGLDAARDGEATDVQAIEAAYHRLAVADGVIREIGGLALTRPSPDESLFAEVENESFRSVVQDIASGS